MTEYNISGCMVTISTETENERFLEKCTEDLIGNVGKIFDKWYASKVNCNAVYDNADYVLATAIRPIVKKGIDILSAQGVYTLDEAAFQEEYLDGYADSFYDALDDMIVNLAKIEGRQEREKQYRKQRKAGRGRVVGGGFGLSGALKGMAAAGAINATTGLAHSVVNTVGNMGSGIAASSNKVALYKNSKAVLRKLIIQSAYYVQIGIREALLNEAGIKCKYVTTEDSSRADAIYKNYVAGRIPESAKQQQILEALVLDPYKIDTYITIWTDFGDPSGDLRRMSSYFGGDLDNYVTGIAKKYGEDLFHRNCSEYEKAFNKKEAAISNEYQIQSTYKALMEYCKSRNISESDIPILGKCSSLLQEIDLEQRTFNNVVYETRDEAQTVRGDYNTFYNFLQGKNIFEEGMFEKVAGLAFHSNDFGKRIKEIFDNEKKLRTVDLVFSNIYTLFKATLQNGIMDSGWINIPNHIGDLSEKEGLIRTANNLPQDEVIIALFDSSSNGKSGIILSNFYIRVFSKGIFSNENGIYPIEKIGKVNCLGNNRYLLEIAGQNSVEINLGKRKLEPEGQISFSKALNDSISLVKNLLPDDRKQMYRLLNTFIICKCGMHLLAEEKICPECKRIVKENGELVETEMCPYCKGIIPAGKKFCNICGSKLLEESVDADAQAVDDSEGRTNINEQAAKLEEQEETKEYVCCSKCGNHIPHGKRFCSKCGNPLVVRDQSENQDIAVTQIRTCSNCNNVINPGKKFCSHCGMKIQ